MRFRTYKNTDLTVSEVGFGLWTISTGWWGNFTEGEAIALMHKAFDLGVTLFDAADTYGNGLSDIVSVSDSSANPAAIPTVQRLEDLLNEPSAYLAYPRRV